MRLEATLTIATDDPLELERISEGLVLSRVDPAQRKLAEQASRLYDGDAAGEGMSPAAGFVRIEHQVPPAVYNAELRAERDAAIATRDQAITDCQFWKTEAKKNADRALLAEGRLRRAKRKPRKR